MGRADYILLGSGMSSDSSEGSPRLTRRLAHPDLALPDMGYDPGDHHHCACAANRPSCKDPHRHLTDVHLLRLPRRSTSRRRLRALLAHVLPEMALGSYDCQLHRQRTVDICRVRVGCSDDDYERVEAFQ